MHNNLTPRERALAQFLAIAFWVPPVVALVVTLFLLACVMFAR